MIFTGARAQRHIFPGGSHRRVPYLSCTASGQVAHVAGRLYLEGGAKYIAEECECVITSFAKATEVLGVFIILDRTPSSTHTTVGCALLLNRFVWFVCPSFFRAGVCAAHVRVCVCVCVILTSIPSESRQTTDTSCPDPVPLCIRRRCSCHPHPHPHPHGSSSSKSSVGSVTGSSSPA